MMAKSWGGLAKSAILMAKQNTIMMDGNDASNGKWQQQNVGQKVQQKDGDQRE